MCESGSYARLVFLSHFLYMRKIHIWRFFSNSKMFYPCGPVFSFHLCDSSGFRCLLSCITHSYTKLRIKWKREQTNARQSITIETKYRIFFVWYCCCWCRCTILILMWMLFLSFCFAIQVSRFFVSRSLLHTHTHTHSLTASFFPPKLQHLSQPNKIYIIGWMLSRALSYHCTVNSEHTYIEVITPKWKTSEAHI